MSPRALVLPLVALALAGCLSTEDEPFALVGGDAVATRPGEYACRTFNPHGAVKAERGRLILLRRDKQTQYVFVTLGDASAEPAALHRVGEGVYLIAVAHAEDRGEDLYLAEAAAGASFRLYAPAEAALAATPALAAKTGATLAHNAFGDDLSGPLEAQRAFAVAFAGDLRNWRLAADCRRR